MGRESVQRSIKHFLSVHVCGVCLIARHRPHTPVCLRLIFTANANVSSPNQILESVKKSKRMQILRASDNAIDAVGQQLLVECVSLNLPLTDLQVENCGLSEVWRK